MSQQHCQQSETQNHQHGVSKWSAMQKMAMMHMLIFQLKQMWKQREESELIS